MSIDVPKRFSVCAVVVIYHPELALLQQVVETSLAQVDELVIVDNTPIGAEIMTWSACESTKVTVLRQNKNIGVAAGLNVGIKFARRKNPTHYLLLDQDSLPAPDMVMQLRNAWKDADSSKLQVAAAGPAFVDDRGGAPPPFLKIGFPSNIVVEPVAGLKYVQTNVLITSGSLVAEAALANAGLMSEWLFIDNVDLEWGFRVQALGWHLIGAPQAKLTHQIGDDHLIAPTWARWIFRRQIAVRHNDFRLYYIFRNRIALYLLPTVPPLWKLQDLIRLPIKIALCLSISDKPFETAKRLFIGIRDGLISKSACQQSIPPISSLSAGKTCNEAKD